MKRRIAILDLNFMTYTYHSTPQASMYAMLISGWHKAQGDSVAFFDHAPDFKFYDLVYLIKDRPGVPHLPSWLAENSAVPVGDWWEKDGVEPFYNSEWEKAPPDNTIYWGWLERHGEKYPKYNKERLKHFYLTPHKINRNGKLYFPDEGSCLIIDNDIHKWDKDFELFMKEPISKLRFAYPILLDERWAGVLKFIDGKQAERQHLILEMNYENYEDDDKLDKALEEWKKYKFSRLVRIRMNVYGYSEEEWDKNIERVYHILERFRVEGGKMISVQPFNIDSYSCPKVLTELKRWSATRVAYSRNSLFDYMVFNGCRDIDKMMDFLENPYSYHRHGRNKLGELITFAENKPELLKIISKSYKGTVN